MHFVIIPTQRDQHGDLGRLMPAETTEQIEAIERIMAEDNLRELTVYSGSSDDLDDEQGVVETRLRIVTDDDDDESRMSKAAFRIFMAGLGCHDDEQ